MRVQLFYFAAKNGHLIANNTPISPSKRWGSKLILSLAFLFILATASFAPKYAEARYASIVIDSRTGKVLFSRNADKKLYPASLTKIMTLYLTFDAIKNGRLTPDTKLKVSARAEGQAPTKLGLKRGSTITVRDAMFALITKSANDAATVLAEGMAPTESAFARKMTEQAKKLGMSRTSFRNASGLPNRRQKSTAHDMALLGAAMIHDFPGFYKYLAMQSFNYKGKAYKNHNNLLGKYSGADGIKTGYIRASGFNLVASAKRGPNRLIGVVFGGRTSKSRDLHMKKLLDSGFEKIEQLRSFAIPLPAVKPLNVALGMPHIQRTEIAAKVAKNIPIASAKPTLDVPTPPARATSEGSDWGIQIGAFSRAGKARDQLNLATRRSNDSINSGRFHIQKVTHNGTPIYRAQMLGFTEDQASDICRGLQKQSMTCFIVSPGTGNLARVAQN